MAPDKLTPNDTRVEYCKATIRGKTYHYVLGKPQDSDPKATILLVHGFPDLAFGWRYQVPFLVSLGLRVLVPDLLGYGQTESPEDLAAFSQKSMSDDLAELARLHVGPDGQILLGGHDWGGALAWRLALWHPRLVRAVFSVCTPYAPPLPVYLPLEAVVARVPNFAYQVQFAGPDVEREIAGPEKLRQFLNGTFGGRGPGGEAAFSATEGVLFANLPLLGHSPLLSDAELDHYVAEFARHGMRGPLNWYRTRRVNYDEEMELVKAGRTRIGAPALMISASRDTALPPAMTDGMERHFDKLGKALVNAHHWALVEAAGEVNKLIGEFLAGVLEPGTVKASI